MTGNGVRLGWIKVEVLDYFRLRLYEYAIGQSPPESDQMIIARDQ
jgi:hypothetical protein